MTLNDTLSGLLVMALGLVAALSALTFPPMPGQAIGPALFPAIVGGGLVIFGAGLVIRGRRAQGAPWIRFDDWVRRPRMLVNGLLVPADLVFYAASVDYLGFLVTGVVFLGVLLLAFRVKVAWVMPIAVGVTLAMHYGFYTLLRVPLPWGVLEGIAW